MQLTVESILVSSSKPMIKLTQLCWQMLTDPLLLITAGNNHVHWSGSGEAVDRQVACFPEKQFQMTGKLAKNS